VSQDLINRLYRAFSARDHETMARCYAADACFSDPVFTNLRGPEVADMWRMLCRRATDLKIEFTNVRGSGESGSAHWEAWYTYTATGRPVHNVIDATFTFRDGLIATHRDAFGLYRWARQALGPMGLLLGWTPFVQRTIRRKAREALAASSARVSAA